ncbi:MAE_28990/MAE_18760 family HEPN-like nuclease [Enterococcus faecalis]|uniref:MAE_28990/MAE_18760 family HEPN-like nuclease n=1 Tax=Enterococcus faecalis TaxID=1351 RepID=UPI0011587B54|nr:MAE_28990/MAE_18760 family HEPN-like nuclease [Enterococcus faecalis]
MNVSMNFEFEKRISEVEYYFFCLRQLYTFNEQKQSETLKKKMKNDVYDFQDFLVILKANSFIVLYNLVEASVKNFIIGIYDEVAMQNLSYNDICDKLKKMWIDVYYNDLSHTTTNYSQHKEKAKKMIEFIIAENKVDFGDEVKLSGNADLKQIKKMFDKHGMNIDSSVIQNAGEGLLEVKNKRNHIAHGNISFIEGGRDSSITDLNQYKDEIIRFLNALNKEVSEYIDNQKYLC